MTFESTAGAPAGSAAGASAASRSQIVPRRASSPACAPSSPGARRDRSRHREGGPGSRGGVATWTAQPRVPTPRRHDRPADVTDDTAVRPRSPRPYPGSVGRRAGQQRRDRGTRHGPGLRGRRLVHGARRQRRGGRASHPRGPALADHQRDRRPSSTSARSPAGRESSTARSTARARARSTPSRCDGRRPARGGVRVNAVAPGTVDTAMARGH